MTDTSPKTRLWTQDGFIKDAYSRVEAAEDIAAADKALIPLELFLSLDEVERAGLIGKIGVEVPSGAAVEPLLPYLAQLPMIALAFPAYTDGRSYSKAQLLRTRHGYKGELRATGDVLLDQVDHMLRVGFSTLEISHAPTIARLEKGDLAGIPHAYQPSAKPAERAGAYSWRRLAG